MISLSLNYQIKKYLKAQNFYDFSLVSCNISFGNKMGFKLLIFLCALVSSVLAQIPTDSSLTCTFITTAVGYSCNLQFNNSAGRDDFTEIRGVHLEGMTNADVRVILSTSGQTNNVPQIVCNEFPNLEYLDLTNLGINTVGENAFSACRSLRWLRLWNNQIWQLPVNVFESNSALTYLDLDSNWLNQLPVGIFSSLTSLETLELANNFFNYDTSIPDDTFSTLTNLTVLLIYNCGLTRLNPSWFASLTRLEQLNVYRNNFASIEENTFENLSNLLILDGSINFVGLREIHPNAFRNLVNLRQLNLNNAGITELNPSWFETLTRLNYLYMSFNRIQEIPPETFQNQGELRSLSLWGNQLKIIRRNSFGFLGNLTFLDLEQNGLNAFDQRVINDAVELRTVYLTNNVCTSGSFFDVINNREVFIERMRNCFCNFLHYVGE